MFDDDKFDRWFGTFWVFAILFSIAFWTVVGIVAYHFAHKYW